MDTPENLEQPRNPPPLAALSPEKLDEVRNIFLSSKTNLKPPDRLEVIPIGWFTKVFTIMAGSTPVAEIDASWWTETWALMIRGTPFKATAHREGALRGTFALESAGAILARADKSGSIQPSFQIKLEDVCYTLQSRSGPGPVFSLFDGSTEIGSVVLEGLYPCKSTITLPDEIPLPAKIFIFWLAARWGSSDNSAGFGVNMLTL